MSAPIKGPRLLAFSATPHLSLAENFQETLHAEVPRIKQLLGEGLIALSSADSQADLLFIRACVNFRIPVIVLADSDRPHAEDDQHLALSKALLSVALAKYTMLNTGTRAISSYLLEWADVLLLANSPSASEEILENAIALGIPTRTLSPAVWRIPFVPVAAPRHGFDTRRDLLDFLDLRFGGKQG